MAYPDTVQIGLVLLHPMRHYLLNLGVGRTKIVKLTFALLNSQYALKVFFFLIIP